MGTDKLLKRYKAIHDTRQKYLAIADKFDDERLNRKPAPDKWSMNQVMMHLYNSEDFILKFIQRRLTKDSLTDAGIPNSIKFILLNIILKLPLKFKVPKAIGTPPENIDYPKLKADWMIVNETFTQVLNNYPQKLEGKEIFKHPRAGELTIAQTLTFIADHMEHHEFQMETLAK